MKSANVKLKQLLEDVVVLPVDFLEEQLKFNVRNSVGLVTKASNALCL